MSLISLLIALAAERYLSSSLWQFKTYYQQYLKFAHRFDVMDKAWKNITGIFAFLILPVIVVHGVLWLIEDGLLHLIISTAILIICFGSFATRDTYKNYLMAAFRGELTTCKLHHSQLTQDKNLPEMGFGQTLIWLNYRYYIAIMFFFVVFGAPGAVFYRLLITIIEKQTSSQKTNNEAVDDTEVNAEFDTVIDTDVYNTCQQILFWIDWLPVRLTSFGYMFVGHFSKALPIWLESVFDITKPAHSVLADVAEKSEDLMLDKQDCTAEPCLLVRLAKRNLLLFLAVVAILTLSGMVA